ncbi:MAG: hypothetical protein JNL21_39335 [Myxococcales bacterium]|nr:hypothetical protein [Myxococcales bacterium]
MRLSLRPRHLAITALFLGALVPTLEPTPAEACIHGMYKQVDPVPQGVAEAERFLDQGRPRAAVAKLKSVDPSLISRKPGASPTSDLALRVFARAAARTGGELTLGFEGETDGEGAAGKRLEWAAATMRELAQKQPSDAGITTDLAEVLAQDPTKREEAKRALAELETADLVGTAHAYAALARLRTTAQPAQPAYLAAARSALDQGRIAIDLARCERMTKDKASCSLAEPREISANEPPAPVMQPFRQPKAIPHPPVI